jgi:FixJ family two-component response regulator
MLVDRRQSFLPTGKSNCRSSGGGLEAVEILGEIQAVMAAVVLDATMPSMHGAATFHALREIRPGVPVLFVSGHGSQGMARLFESKEAVAFLEKPFSVAALGERIGAVIAT